MKKKNFFEGWYFKLQGEDMTMALIPEISYDEQGEATGSLQVVFPHRAFYFSFNHPVSLSDNLYVVLGKNVFTDVCIHMDLRREYLTVKGDIYIEDEGKGFHVMGPLAVLPLPCKHDILSMEQRLSGELEINGKKFSFYGKKGYLEKDMGSSFPKTYMWTQCNDFDGAECRITSAVAEIPVGKFCFTGTFACIEHEQKKYKLASYKGAKVISFDEEGFEIVQGNLRFSGKRSGGSAVLLRSPKKGKMAESTREYLICTVEYRLKDGDEEIFCLNSDRASYEFL